MTDGPNHPNDPSFTAAIKKAGSPAPQPAANPATTKPKRKAKAAKAKPASAAE